MGRRDVPGTVYLAHLDPPYQHARHYLGFAEGGVDELASRLAEHGGPHGSRLLAAQRAAGGTWHITRTWQGTRALERSIKRTRHVPHYCPDCQPQRAAERRDARVAGQLQKGSAMAATEIRPPAETAPGREPGYFDLAGRRVREVVASSPSARAALFDVARAQNQLAGADEVWTAGVREQIAARAQPDREAGS